MGWKDKILRGTGAGTSGSSGNASASKKKEKEEPPPELTPLEKLLQNAGAVREDGSDKFFGLENVRCLAQPFVNSIHSAIT
ncbi:hypothetical protein MCOR07_007443 [Pyricularia oryzae]|nr:hypothetical protein MCOR26_003666 [Pyricularia oryzae]KAI6311337.1 hypothetical protein MCOR29_008311 [Pyricularia oryzae]KAI6342914.1 hypothetical protein MCOR30_001731 [Pyricularia oryzae]KAI6384376.1 hypothetical protein MCOR32_002100 [Pyricularia oryzae]KAI6413272.1 hypothetical protein MCOR20_003012 [Pyricularia oryzae]